MVITELSRKQVAVEKWRVGSNPTLSANLYTGGNMNKIVKEKIKQAFLLFIIIISFVCVLAIMLKYETEGEKNMPFSLEEMLIVSSADGQTKSEN